MSATICKLQTLKSKFYLRFFYYNNHLCKEWDHQPDSPITCPRFSWCRTHQAQTDSAQEKGVFTFKIREISFFLTLTSQLSDSAIFLLRSMQRDECLIPIGAHRNERLIEKSRVHLATFPPFTTNSYHSDWNPPCSSNILGLQRDDRTTWGPWSTAATVAASCDGSHGWKVCSPPVCFPGELRLRRRHHLGSAAMRGTGPQHLVPWWPGGRRQRHLRRRGGGGIKQQQIVANTMFQPRIEWFLHRSVVSKNSSSRWERERESRETFRRHRNVSAGFSAARVTVHVIFNGTEPHLCISAPCGSALLLRAVLKARAEKSWSTLRKKREWSEHKNHTQESRDRSVCRCVCEHKLTALWCQLTTPGDHTTHCTVIDLYDDDDSLIFLPVQLNMFI